MPNETFIPDSSGMQLSPLYIQENMRNLFTISSEGKDAFARIDELIWQYACGAESATFTSIPLYFLEPNTRIKYKGEDYLITKLTLPITHNGTMSISATKIIRPI